MADCRFRFANENDCRLILKFIRSLAKYEKMEDEVVATEELLREWLFEKKKAEVIFAMDGEEVVGFALFFHNFSTFLGRAGIYLEDLYVRPSYRGKGEHRLLQVSGRRAAGRVDGLSCGREGAAGFSVWTSGVICPHLSILNPHLGTNDPRGHLFPNLYLGRV